MSENDGSTENAIPKGIHLPLFHFADNDGIKESSNCTLIPSWVSGGLFPVNHGSDEAFHKRRKRNNNADERSSNKDVAHYSNLEQLIAREIRNCDVCGRHVLWTRPMYHSYFEPSRTDTDSSIADSLPQFIGRYLTHSAIPCSFCAEAHQSKIRETHSWCGTLYCSKACQSIGEENAMVTEENSQDCSQIGVPPPKLFFCRNRILATIKFQDCVGVQEVLDSLNTIKERLLSICGASSNDVQTIGMEECALFITTMLCCSSHWKVDKLLSMYSSTNDTIRRNAGLDTSEEGLVEEMWVMARSHWSLLHSNLDLLQTGSSNNQHLDASFPSYHNFEHLHIFIKRYCLVRVSPSTHPLISYTTNTLLSSKNLSDSDREYALDTLQVPTMKEVIEASDSDSSIQSAITLWRRATHISHWLSSSSSEQQQSLHIRFHSKMNKSYYAFLPLSLSKLKHSCAPTLLMVMNDGSVAAKTENEHDNKLAWLTLHSFTGGEESLSKIGSLGDDLNSRNMELKRLMGSDFTCGCERCQYERQENINDIPAQQLKRLGDIAMQQSRFEEASNIYDAILKSEPNNADVFHAKAASFLGRASSANFSKLGHCHGFFVQAQHLWSQVAANTNLEKHADISVILQKQNAYRTIQHLSSDDVTSSNNDYSTDKAFKSFLNEKVFLTDNNAPVITSIECQKVIQSAEEYAKQTGWTTSRHYAVPTTDIPLHDLADLKPWFYDVWSQRIRPLLRDQFKLNTTASTRTRDIYIHDAFVVRYDANGGQRNLPPHYDESTHSFIIALNTDFEGGGTYIHTLNRALKPEVAGGMISFCGGELLHSGDSVVKGTRYVIVAFCYIDLIVDKQVSKCEASQTSGHTSGFSFGFSF